MPIRELIPAPETTLSLAHPVATLDPNALDVPAEGEALRSLGHGVVPVELPGAPGQPPVRAWAVTDHDAARHILDSEDFGKDPKAWAAYPDHLPVPFPLEQVITAPLLSDDGSDHRRLRRLIGHAFTARRVEALRGRVEEIARELLDAMPTGETVDLRRHYPRPLPIRVISELFGLDDPHNQERLANACDALLDSHVSEEQVGAAQAVIHEVITGLIERLPVEGRGLPGRPGRHRGGGPPGAASPSRRPLRAPVVPTRPGVANTTPLAGMPPVARWAVIRGHPREGTVVTVAECPPIPRAAGSLPLLGHMIPLIRDNIGFIASLRCNYGPVVEITLQPGTRTVIVQDPTLIRTMLIDLGPSLDKGRFFDKMGQLLGDSVVTAAGQNHVRKRRQLQPAFARDEIARYVDIMREEVTATVDGWEAGRTFDVREAMVRLSLDMLARTVFSGSLDDTAFRRLRHDLSVVMAGVGARVMLPDWVERLPLPFNRRFDRARDAVRATINQAVDELQASGHDTGDMLSMLLRARDEETGRPLSGHQICSEILTLAVAGTETTASVLSWALYELSRHPDIEERVLAELADVLGDRPVTFADVTRLPYLRRVIDEVLRLHHTGLLVTRRTMTETRLGQWTLPAGTELAYCQHALHRDPALFPNPTAFDPDRWLDTEQPAPSGAFLPFGAGKHKCIGDRFALTELITAIATITRRVRFDVSGEQPVRPVAGATVRPSTMLMTARPRRGYEHSRTSSIPT